MTTARVERVRQATRGLDRDTAATARDVLLAAFGKVLNEPVQFRSGGRHWVVGSSALRQDCSFSVRMEPEVFSDILSYGNLGLGEAYMRGDFIMETGELEDFLTLLLRCRADEEIKRTARLAIRAAGVNLRNALRTRSEVVGHHYDVGNDLYELMLGPTMAYTCGYAESPDDSLETMQFNKFKRVCRKLRLEEGERVLDMGCGFGGLLMFAAEEYGIYGVGVTISRAQYEWAKSEVARRGLSDRVDIRLGDYRDVGGTYDKVVSVGLTEHVPPSEYPTLFRKVASALKPSSIGLMHCVGTNKFRPRRDAFTQKYIFPGSCQVELPAVVTAMQKVGLAVLDVDNMKPHYAPTLAAWLSRFRAARDEGLLDG
jgi:cyclopropane-fatty-acyl-phospholipid synthase